MKKVRSALMTFALIITACGEGHPIQPEGQPCGGGERISSVERIDRGLINFGELQIKKEFDSMPVQLGFDYREDRGSAVLSKANIGSWSTGFAPGKRLWVKALIYIGRQPAGFSGLLMEKGGGMREEYCFDGSFFYKR